MELYYGLIVLGVVWFSRLARSGTTRLENPDGVIAAAL